MKKIIFSLCVALLMTISSKAQQISVVSSGGSTSLYGTLQEAIEGAEDGSVIYLPGGSFAISNDVKITKKLTIIGIGHKGNTDNVDGNTIISGNIYFNEGSSGSAVMGCYITSDLYIGDDGSAVNDVLIRYCNLYSVYVKNANCINTIVNQNYIRSGGSFSDTAGEITNNVIYSYIGSVNGGIISNNIIGSRLGYNRNVGYVNNSTITNNIFLAKNNTSLFGIHGSNNTVSGNMAFQSLPQDEDVIDMTGVDPNDVFENYNNGVVSPASDFHFKEAYKSYENRVGVYANGTNFDKQMAPVPYIVAKRVDEQTDASGKLNVKIRVKAGE